MSDQRAQRDVPSPELVAAWLKLDVLVDPRQVPMWAAHWVVEGRDTPAVRHLAGLDGRDPFAVREVTAQALVEMHISVDDLQEAAGLVLTNEAEWCLAGRTSERAVATSLYDFYVRSGYADEILREPLGAEHGINDEWVGGWGRTENHLRDAIRSACLRQVAHRS